MTWKHSAGALMLRWYRALVLRLGPNSTLIITLVVGMIIAVGLSFVGVAVYDAVTESDGISQLDQPLLHFGMSLRSPWLDVIVIGYTDIAGTIGMPIVAVSAILLLSLRWHSFTPAILIAAAGTGSLLMTIAGKDLIGRDRPPLADAVAPYEYSPSFPSGHTLNAVVVAGTIAYLLVLHQRSTRARVVTVSAAVFFAVTVGLSRVFLGHHWFTDVAAGWALGAAWLALVITAHRLFLATRRPLPGALEPPPPGGK